MITTAPRWLAALDRWLGKYASRTTIWECISALSGDPLQGGSSDQTSRSLTGVDTMAFHLTVRILTAVFCIAAIVATMP